MYCHQNLIGERDILSTMPRYFLHLTTAKFLEFRTRAYLSFSTLGLVPENDHKGNPVPKEHRLEVYQLALSREGQPLDYERWVPLLALIEGTYGQSGPPCHFFWRKVGNKLWFHSFHSSCAGCLDLIAVPGHSLWVVSGWWSLLPIKSLHTLYLSPFYLPG